MDTECSPVCRFVGKLGSDLDLETWLSFQEVLFLSSLYKQWKRDLKKMSQTHCFHCKHALSSFHQVQWVFCWACPRPLSGKGLFREELYFYIISMLLTACSRSMWMFDYCERVLCPQRELLVVTWVEIECQKVEDERRERIELFVWGGLACCCRLTLSRLLYLPTAVMPLRYAHSAWSSLAGENKHWFQIIVQLGNQIRYCCIACAVLFSCVLPKNTWKS